MPNSVSSTLTIVDHLVSIKLTVSVLARIVTDCTKLTSRLRWGRSENLFGTTPLKMPFKL